MVSYRLRLLFLLSAFIFIAHSLEEYLTDFHHIDPIFTFVFAPLLHGDAHQAAFITFQIMVWIFLMLSFLMLQGKKWMLRLLSIPGIIMIFELHHVFQALLIQSYYSGLITALLFPIMTFFYWKELLREIRAKNQ